MPVINEWLTRRLSPLGRLRRWCREGPDAPMLIAGALVCTVTTALCLWGLLGIVLYWSGFQGSARPLRATAEIALFISGVYLPLAFLGWRTIRGDVRSLWLATIALACDFVVMLLWCIGIGPDWLDLESTISIRSPSTRVQMFSLICGIVLVGFALHVWALVATHAWRRVGAKRR